MDRSKRLLCVHQGSELYGSDRVFLQSVRAFRQTWPDTEITVHLPSQGPLAQALQAYATRIIIGDLFVLRLAYCRFKYWRNLLHLPSCFRAAWKNIHQNDVVYVSSATVAGYLLLLRFARKPAILHVHEYLSGPIGWGLNWLIKFSKARVIANSQATANALTVKNIRIVSNGVADTALATHDETSLPLRILLIGRISPRKGHTLAIEAIKKLKDDGVKDIRLAIVGGVFEDQNDFVNEIKQTVKTYQLENQIAFHDFQSDPSAFYKQAHIVLVPSIKPESFGLTAVEGMMWSLPVIATNTGGLKEITVPNETGYVVQVNNVNALAEAIRKYVVHPSLLKKHGNSGRMRYDALYTEKHYFNEFIQAARQCIQSSKDF